MGYRPLESVGEQGCEESDDEDPPKNPGSDDDQGSGPQLSCRCGRFRHPNLALGTRFQALTEAGFG